MDKKSGLTSVQATELLKINGPNVLPEKPPTSDVAIFFRQFGSPLIYILIIAAGISWYLKDNVDAFVIMLAVLVNTILGFYQERKAERGLVALKRIVSPRAKVIRNGVQQEISAAQIVAGDIVVLASGDRIPADGILVEAAELSVNEAILTGESFPVVKRASLEEKEETAELHAEHAVLMGTTVVAGIGKMQVTATALKTQLGSIAKTLSETEEEPTPLQKRLSGLAKTLTIIIVVAALLIFGVGFYQGEHLATLFATSVAVAVAAIPEGLVIALTSILALGMQRILKRRALVRKLVVAETLGTVTVIATDKTGTLTEGKLKVVKTDFTEHDKALIAATLANHLLDPLEIALWEWLSAQPKFDPEEVAAKNIRSYLLPFDANRKFSATVYNQEIYCIGAPEVLLAKSTLSTAEKKFHLNKIEEWGRQGLRILAVGFRPDPKGTVVNSLKEKHELDSLQFLGMVGFADPVRGSVKEALAMAREAGISVKVVTGDYRWTAQAILAHAGIHITDAQKQILEGEELLHLDQEELTKRVKDVILFARVNPAQKLAIVEALKTLGEVVALLGDGVNDAPALKRADIGIVVGDATDVARETADLVLLDSNFATIVAAIEEGRGIFANIQKVLTYLLSDTFAEVTLIFLGLVFGVPLPLTAAQILWINLVTDTFPTLALTLEPKEKHLLKRLPISSDLPLLGKSVVAFMLIASFTSGIAIFILYLFILTTTRNIDTARLVAFTAFSIKSLVYVFSLRDKNQAIFKLHLFSNPWLWVAVGIGALLQLVGLYVPFFNNILRTRPLTPHEWALVGGVCLLIVVIIELAKFIRITFLRRRV